jgi:hypothetical protein
MRRAGPRVAPRSHDPAKRDNTRQPPTHQNPHGYAQTRMSRPPPHVHGKEGVDGSSPSEGLYESPANRYIVLPVVARYRFVAGMRRRSRSSRIHGRSQRNGPPPQDPPARRPRSSQGARLPFPPVGQIAGFPLGVTHPCSSPPLRLAARPGRGSGSGPCRIDPRPSRAHQAPLGHLV